MAAGPYYFLRKVIDHRVVWAPTTGYQFVGSQSQVVESAAASGCTTENPNPQSPSTSPLPLRLGASLRQPYDNCTKAVFNSYGCTDTPHFNKVIISFILPVFSILNSSRLVSRRSEESCFCVCLGNPRFIDNANVSVMCQSLTVCIAHRLDTASSLPILGFLVLSSTSSSLIASTWGVRPDMACT